MVSTKDLNIGDTYSQLMPDGSTKTFKIADKIVTLDGCLMVRSVEVT